MRLTAKQRKRVEAEALLCIDGQVCACGHVESIHVFANHRLISVLRCSPRCRCKQFRPVTFRVEVAV